MSWEERYQQQDTPWDKGAPAPPLLDLLQRDLSCFGTGAVLVPGCGRGHDARAIAQALPESAVIGLDLAETAVAQAIELGTPHQLSYQVADFLNTEAADLPPVSAVFEHTCFCAIDPSLRPAYAASCARLIPSGGYWVAIIFLTPREEDDPTIGPPFQSSVPEISALFSADFTLIDSYQPERAYKGRAGKELVMIWQRR